MGYSFVRLESAVGWSNLTLDQWQASFPCVQFQHYAAKNFKWQHIFKGKPRPAMNHHRLALRLLSPVAVFFKKCDHWLIIFGNTLIRPSNILHTIINKHERRISWSWSNDLKMEYIPFFTRLTTCVNKEARRDDEDLNVTQFERP